MAQLVRYNEVELQSILSQAKEKALLHQTNAKNNAYGLKMPGGYVPAAQLKYAEPEGWTITPLYAVLNGCHELRVSGEYPTEKLDKLFYEVSYEVMLLSNCNIKEVILTLTLPDGSKQTHIESLDGRPRNEPISLIAGKFFNQFECGNIIFELKGTECETLKTGLVIFGVLIKPIIKPPFASKTNA